MSVPGLILSAESAGVPWRRTSVPGVSLLLLGPEAPAAADGPREAAVLIRMEPGCGYPAHRHVDVEDVLVLAGGYRDERGEHRSGTYVRYEPGSVHAPVALGDPRCPDSAENPACLLFAVARRGIELVGEHPARTDSRSAETARP